MAINKEKVMEAARKLAEKNQLDKAVKEYLRIVQEDPADLRVWLKIGDLHIKRGSKQDATEVYLRVARVYQEQGFLQKAVAVFKQVLKIDPHLVDVNLKLAELFRQLGLLGEAMQHFEAVAGHFHREGNTKEALATVRQLVELDPDNVATRIKLAELYSKENLTTEAIAEFTLATNQLRKLGRQEDFIKVAERLLWHQPSNIELSRELAGLYLRRGDARRALQKLQACFKADGRDVETLAMLAQAFQALDQISKTVSVLKELAKVHDENKHATKADEVFRKILEFEPNDADAKARFAGKRAGTAAPAGRAPTPPPVSLRSPPPQARGPAPAPVASVGSRPRVQTPEAAGRMTGSVPLVGGFDDLGPSTPTPSLREQLKEDSSYREGSLAGERHAEEIARMLVDTDTYIKYGLHQKAIDRLKLLFALDPDNFEGRERLKDVYLAQGREADALAELTRLVDVSAPIDPERALTYVREALSIDAGYLPMLELVRRHRLDFQAPAPAGAASGVIAVDDLGDDLAVGDDSDAFDDLAHDLARSAHRGQVARPGYRPTSAGDDDDFDPLDLISPTSVPHGSPAPTRAPGYLPPLARGAAPAPGTIDLTASGDDDDFALDDAQLPAETRQLAPGAAAALAHSAMADGDELEFDDGMMASAHVGSAVGRAITPGPRGDWQPPTWSARGGAGQPHGGVHEILPAAGGDGEDELPYEDLPFDPDAARAFDAQVRAPAAEPASVALDTAPVADLGDLPELGGGFAHEQATQLAVGLPADLLAEHGLVPAPAPAPAAFAGEPSSPSGAVHTPAPVLIEDDLDEADFYVSQGMFVQAREILAALHARHPGHRIIAIKLAELDRAEAGEPLGDPEAMAPDPAFDPTMHVGAAAAVDPGTGSVDVDFTSAGGARAPSAPAVAARASLDEGVEESAEALDLDEIEELDDADVAEMAAEELGELPDAGSAALSLDAADAQLDGDLDAELGAALGEPDVTGLVHAGPHVEHDEFRGTTGGGKPAVMLEKPIEEGDADTHFDLGQAYKEMGLYDAAIQAFEKSVRSPHRQAQSQLMLGLCFREQGDALTAAGHFKQALHAPVITDLERLSLTYELGVTYDALGDVGEALYFLEQVVARDPSFIDAAARVTRLRGGASLGHSTSDTGDEHPLR
jgi:pilus assembly protein FimV